ncbi:hypothetical protein F5Y03DRAFT_303223 [Xylaria venustula]|nr:hypothetical protein F5Y03DRAFT_303223 [Xylaria venustula]
MPTCLVVLENLDYDYGLFENDYSGSHEHEKMTPLTPRLFGDIGYIGSPSVLNAEGEAGEPRSCPSPHIRSWVHDPESSTFQWMSQPIELMPNIYDCVVIGSGYGGGLAAARMAQTEFEGDGSINANLILADTVATVTSSLCAWVIRQYDKSLDHQSITPHERQLLEHSIFQLTKLFEQPLLPVLTIGLVYAAGVSTVYYLHRHDKYLNPALGLGSCTAIAAGLLQGMGMRGAIVQLVPGAVALALLLSGVFHYLFVAESKQRQCDIHTGSKFHWDRAEWTKWIYHDEDDMKLESQQPDQVLLDEKNMV